MPQLHLYVSDEVAERVRQRAAARGLSVSRFLAEMLRREVGEGWPPGFFDDVVGGWQGAPLQRPRQGRPESREPL